MIYKINMIYGNIPELRRGGGKVVGGIGQVLSGGRVPNSWQYSARRRDHVPARLSTTTTYTLLLSFERNTTV
jgi:hypothetical protein